MNLNEIQEELNTVEQDLNILLTRVYNIRRKIQEGVSTPSSFTTLESQKNAQIIAMSEKRMNKFYNSKKALANSQQ